MSASLRRSSSAKGGGGSGAVAAATVVVSSTVPITWRAASSARNRLDSSGAAPFSTTFRPSISVEAQSWPVAARAAWRSAAVARSYQAVAVPASLQAP